MTDKLEDKFKEAIISKIPSARLGEPEDIANAVLCLQINQIILMVKLYMLMGACIWLDNQVIKLITIYNKKDKMSEDVSSKVKNSGRPFRN